MRAKVGLLLLIGEWFGQIKAEEGFYRDLPGLVKSDADKIVKTLREDLDIVEVGVINSVEKVKNAVRQFKENDIDLLVICYLMWGEDRLMIKALEELPRLPILLWCYSPRRELPRKLNMVDLFRGSGPVGTVQGSATLKKTGRDFGFAFGCPEEAVKEIVDYAQAAKLAGELKKTKFGLLPCPCSQMTGTYVDEARFKREIGAEIRHISVREYFSLTREIPESEVERYVKGLKSDYKIEVSDKALFKTGRASLGLARVVKEFQLSALALEDLNEELHRVMGLRPCLYVPSLFDRAVVSMEGEIGGAIALLILKKLTDKPPMYTEIFTFDETENTILAGHAGIHDINLADDKTRIRITPDREYMELEEDTAWMQFMAKPGKVTLLSLFCDVDRFKLIISSGEALSGEEKLDGSPHIYIKLTTPLREFFAQAVKTGMTQHWAIVHEDVTSRLINLADILNLHRVVVE